MIGYLRVSTEEQGDVGGGMAAQRARIEVEALRRGWTIERWIEDEASASTVERPGLQEALLLLEGGRYRGLIVAKLDRLSRSVLDASGIFAAAEKQGWSLVSLEPQVDMTTPYGKAMAQMAVVFAELERELIGQRTSEAMQALIALDRAEGRPSRFGRRPSIPDHIVKTVLQQRARGMGPREIARRLNASGKRNMNGEPWASGSVSSLLRRLDTGQTRPAVES